MEFDKSKVFTPFNCGEVKIGSKGYVSDYYQCLKDYVEDGFTSSRFGTLVNNDGKFQLENNNTTYQLFYLVEEPKEPTKRPCTREELVEMLKKQGVLMLKNADGKYYTISKIDSTKVIFCDDMFFDFDYEHLCTMFTLLDGTELWVEE